ncbi:MAG: hypothetical protein AB7G15_04540 [Alphaproteobacteria bacterium]
MSFTFHLTFRNAQRPEARVSAADLDAIKRLIGGTPGLAKAHLYTPERAHDPYLDDGPPPLLALQLYFPALPTLEAAASRSGHLQALVDGVPSLAGAEGAQQAMVARDFAAPDPRFQGPPGQLPCTYLVAYSGTAPDENLWIDYYISHHPAIMARFPGIREIEVATRVEWIAFLPWRRENCLLRNKVVFDSSAALTASLNSPVRHEMRADYNNFPPFTGANTHYPMATHTIFGRQ